eukprot:scaffold12.g8216.t1
MPPPTITRYADEPANARAFERALETVADAFTIDDPATFLTRRRDGGRHFLPALICSIRQEVPMELFVLGDFDCVAFLHDEPPADRRPPEGTGPATVAGEVNVDPRSDAVVAAHRDGSAPALVAAGVSRGDAALLQLAAPDRLSALHCVLTGLPDMVRRYVAARAGGAPVWHFDFLAVRPDRHGGGLGTQMLLHLTALADARGAQMYLEASTPASRRLYLRHDFADFDSLLLPTADTDWEGRELRFYAMGRLPRTGT